MAYLISLVVLLFIIISDIQYHDGHQFKARIFSSTLPINGFWFFMVTNLIFLTFISNALIANGPLKSIPENMYDMFWTGFRNSFKFPFICLGKLTTLFGLIAQLYFLLFWLLELMPSGSYLKLTWHGPYCVKYASILFGILALVTTFIICVFQREKLGPAITRTATVVAGTFCGYNKLQTILMILCFIFSVFLCGLMFFWVVIWAVSDYTVVTYP